MAVRGTLNSQVATAARRQCPKIICSYCGRSGRGRVKNMYSNGPPAHSQKQTEIVDNTKGKVALVTSAL